MASQRPRLFFRDEDVTAYSTWSNFLDRSVTFGEVTELREGERLQVASILGDDDSAKREALKVLSEQVYASPRVARNLADRVRDGLFDEAGSWVYFIGKGENGAVKIGWSTSPNDRLATLQSSHDEPLTILVKVVGGFALEQMLHRVFSPDRIRGEWFRRSQVIVDFIRAMSIRTRGDKPARKLPRRRS